MAKRQQSLIVLLAGAVLLFASLVPAEPGLAQTGDRVEAPLASTGRLGPEFEISGLAPPGADHYRAAVAYNWRHGEYLVAWHNKWPDGHRDIYAQRVSESGELLSWFSITDGPDDRVQPALAYNATNDEYLVV